MIHQPMDSLISINYGVNLELIIHLNKIQLRLATEDFSAAFLIFRSKIDGISLLQMYIVRRGLI